MQQNDSSDKANETLDTYIKEVFEIRCMQYYEEHDTYRENKIDFYPHLNTWDKQGI